MQVNNGKEKIGQKEIENIVWRGKNTGKFYVTD